MNRIPPNWHEMSPEALFIALNDPRRFPTPKWTIEAVMQAVRCRGLAALKEPDNRERLSRCDDRAKAEINSRIDALVKAGRIS